MNNLSHEQKMLAELQGQMLALRACITALLVSMPPEQQRTFGAKLEELSESARSNLLAMTVPEELRQAFDETLAATQQLAAQRSL